MQQPPPPPGTDASSHASPSPSPSLLNSLLSPDHPPAAKRSRISVACDTCRRKKVRCDGEQPCEYCTRARLPCTYQAPKRRGHGSSSGSASASTPHPSSGAQDDAHARSAHPDDAAADELADMMTFLVSLEENGGIHALRSLGSSSGMHLLRMWSDRVSEGVLVVPSILKKHTPSGPETDLPPREIMDLLLDFFFEYLHPFLPVTERQMIYNSLDQPNPPLMLLNSIFAVAARVYEGLSEEQSDKPGASDIFLNRARQIARNILLEPPCLEYIQALLLLSFHELGFLRGSTWLISGVAIRMAQDIGLNRRMDNLSGALSISPMQRHLMKKTWAAVFVMDRFVSAVLGRPVTIHDEDCDVGWPSPDDERELSGEEGALILGDFVELAKLGAILGKVLRNINSVRERSKLAYTLPELHRALSQWLNELPARLRYSFNPSAPTPSRFAAFLNCLYYSTIILLYRPFLSPGSAKTSPLFPQYLHITQTASQAIVFICHARVDELFLMPNVILYCLFTAITTLVISYNCTAAPKPGDGSDPASVPPPAPNPTRANSLTALMKCLVILSTVQEIWPMANRIGFVLEDFFSHHQVRVDVPRPAPRPAKTERVPATSRKCQDPQAVSEAYERLQSLVSDAAPTIANRAAAAATTAPAPMQQPQQPMQQQQYAARTGMPYSLGTDNGIGLPATHLAASLAATDPAMQAPPPPPPQPQQVPQQQQQQQVPMYGGNNMFAAMLGQSAGVPLTPDTLAGIMSGTTPSAGGFPFAPAPTSQPQAAYGATSLPFGNIYTTTAPFPGMDPVMAAASALPPRVALGLGTLPGGAGAFGVAAGAQAAGMGAMDMDEMMGVQPSMELGGLGLDLDAIMFGNGATSGGGAQGGPGGAGLGDALNG
ncbi:hypothetical protein AMAG_05277 [Allomyces macrogynus ATCC 38327]|uniref:Zn(2)-C6 fungal-type domain-containing protein n=1 Tax=Allomyces macrogynus (strain ATCC 38327) TaxID=578462 RepID=A0A0L0SBG2_ALLM3|nr:hypothetical protein AMAG_05277 [Allomyces macrogynus ATCC 38327]|eukprot:KNE59821.1 hypothetical protein AMAG_05277 [Allomyces macrogynus ATCC 38327]